jgi:hypothetical protein
VIVRKTGRERERERLCVRVCVCVCVRMFMYVFICLNVVVKFVVRRMQTDEGMGTSQPPPTDDSGANRARKTPQRPPSTPSDTRQSTPREGRVSPPKVRGRKGSRPASGSCPACGWGAGGHGGAALPSLAVKTAEPVEATPFAVRAAPKSSEELAMMQHSHAQVQP